MALFIYNQIKGAIQDAIEITSNALRGNIWGRDYLDPYIEGGLKKWGQDVFNFAQSQEWGKKTPRDLIEIQPELYLRLAVGLIKNEREQGRFAQLSDDEFNAFIEELKSDPELILNYRKRKEFAIKYDKALQKDLARRKEMAESKVVEDWKKRQLQYRAGIIK